MRTRKAFLLLPFVTLLLAGVFIVVFEWRHYRTYGHFVSYGLHVDPLNRAAYIGIPGQTKMYYAQISNYSFWPVSLPACDYVTDAFGKGTEFPHAVQRWDAASQTWRTIADMSGDGYCRPAPLSTIEDHLVTKRLVPFASVDVSDGEATGARDPFRKGDLARFVVFTKLDKAGDWKTAIPSASFTIEDDVLRDENNPLRVKH